MTLLTHTIKATYYGLFRAPASLTAITFTQIIARSLPIVAPISLFSGAILMIQANNALSIIGGGAISGYIVGLGGLRELFPILALAGVAARTGADFASQIATMKIGSQIDALEVTGISSYRMVVAPKVLACILAAPVLVIIANGIGLGAALLMGVWQLGIDKGSLWSALLIWLEPTDMAVSVLKGMSFGFLIGIISTYEGLNATQGPSGIGRSTNRAVVRSTIAGCTSSLLISYLIFGNTLG